MPSFIQSNTQSGLIVRTPVPSTDFTYAEGLLAKVSSSSGTVNGNQYVDLAGIGDVPLFVVTEVEVTTGETQRVTLQPLSGERNVRGIAAGAINAGVQVAASTGYLNGVVTNGFIRAAITNDYIIGVTEDTASASGAYILFRPVTLGIHA